MKQLTAEWLWRAAIIAVLVWIGTELHQIHQAVVLPADEPATTAAAEPESEPDAVRDELALLNQKLDAIMTAMVQLKR